MVAATLESSLSGLGRAMFQRSNHACIGLSGPTNRTVLDELKFHTRLQIELSVAEDAKLDALIQEPPLSNNADLCGLAAGDIRPSPLADAGPAKEPRPEIDSEIDSADQAPRGGVLDLRQSGLWKVNWA